MPYWSCCPHCKRWSVSASPLSMLKNTSCLYCGHQLTEDTEHKPDTETLHTTPKVSDAKNDDE